MLPSSADYARGKYLPPLIEAAVVSEEPIEPERPVVKYLASIGSDYQKRLEALGSPPSLQLAIKSFVSSAISSQRPDHELRMIAGILRAESAHVTDGDMLFRLVRKLLTVPNVDLLDYLPVSNRFANTVRVLRLAKRLGMSWEYNLDEAMTKLATADGEQILDQIEEALNYFLNPQHPDAYDPSRLRELMGLSSFEFGRIRGFRYNGSPDSRSRLIMKTIEKVSREIPLVIEGLVVTQVLSADYEEQFRDHTREVSRALNQCGRMLATQDSLVGIEAEIAGRL